MSATHAPLQILLCYPGTAECIAKVRILGQNWVMCSKHCKTLVVRLDLIVWQGAQPVPSQHEAANFLILKTLWLHWTASESQCDVTGCKHHEHGFTQGTHCAQSPSSCKVPRSENALVAPNCSRRHNLDLIFGAASELCRVCKALVSPENWSWSALDHCK